MNANLQASLQATLDRLYEFPQDECLDCGTCGTELLEVLFTQDDGTPVWVCPACKVRREQEKLDRAERGRWLATDRTEEAARDR